MPSLTLHVKQHFVRQELAGISGLVRTPKGGEAGRFVMNGLSPNSHINPTPHWVPFLDVLKSHSHAPGTT